MPRGRLEWRLLTAAGWTHPCHSHISSLCQVCVFSVHLCFMFKWGKSHSSCTLCLLFPCVCSVSLRIFSLHVPLASKTLVALIYKPSAGITVSLELKTTDASLCTHVDIQDVKREFLTIRPLSIPAYPLQGCCGGLEPIPAISFYNHYYLKNKCQSASD